MRKFRASARVSGSLIYLVYQGREFRLLIFNSPTQLFHPIAHCHVLGSAPPLLARATLSSFCKPLISNSTNPLFTLGLPLPPTESPLRLDLGIPFTFDLDPDPDHNNGAISSALHRNAETQLEHKESTIP